MVSTNIKNINRSLVVGWAFIANVLLVSYIGEFLKGERTGAYVAVFLVCTFAPFLLCVWKYVKQPDSEKLKVYIVVGYFIMYLFSMLTGSTNMVFSYILPMLSLLILYHDPLLIKLTGIASLWINIYFVVRRYLAGEINIENSKDVEIQIALIVLCFSGCYAATIIYDRITKQNKDFMEQLEKSNEQSKEMTLQTIRTIVNTIDAKDEYTKGHSQRVSAYSKALAKELGLEKSEVERVEYIALLHDIGKIGVPDNILNKAGRLTNEEFAIMKQHTVVGSDILKDIDAIEGLAVGAKYHHEKYDGTGYPEGLKGEEIPYIARIIGICDAYDAMTSNRIYRKRLTKEDVCNEIERCSGTQFDPEIAKAFLNMLREDRLPDCSPDKDPSTIKADKNMANILLQKVLESTGVLNDSDKDKDGLTRLFNRRAGEEILDGYLAETSGCIFMFDIDSLRHVNDVHGMARGDLYLKTVAKIVDSLNEDSLVYRNSSDEFICYVSGVTKPDEVSLVVSNFYHKLEAKKAEDRIFEDMNVSIGSVFADMPKNNLEDLVFKADKALQEAKKQGPNNYCSYNSMKGDATKNLSRIDLNNLIKEIRNQGQYSNAYQVNYPEFVRNVNFIKKISERNDQPMQIVMFTVAPIDDAGATLEQRDEVMEVMRKAVVSSLRSVDVTTPFSSSQRIVILMNLPDENIDIVMQRIVSSFYKMNTNKNFSLSYDIADLQ
jgi:diguanylate cyclase (GGDEF)-like protein/putative nucleotidyltransferase with HDIG domain